MARVHLTCCFHATRLTEHASHWMVDDMIIGEISQRPFHGIEQLPRSATSCERCRAARERRWHEQTSDRA